MRYSYGVMDQKNILIYKPQLFQKTDDLLIFPTTDYRKWHSNITEYIDALFQLNAHNDSIDVDNLNLALGILFNIDLEMQSIFEVDKKMDHSYFYVSQVDEKYKKRETEGYGEYMYHIDRNVLKITPMLKHKHLMEIVDYAHRLWAKNDKSAFKVKKRV
jgi:hypothetical protein